MSNHLAMEQPFSLGSVVEYQKREISTIILPIDPVWIQATEKKK